MSDPTSRTTSLMPNPPEKTASEPARACAGNDRPESPGVLPAEALGGSWRRTHTCGELRRENVGRTVTLNGWVSARRDLGGIYFVEVRDRYGTTQIVLDEALSDATRLAPEFVIAVRGEVVARDPKNVNAKHPTGEIEVRVRELSVLNDSPTPPFEIVDGIDVAVDTRLRYRFLDLRRPSLQRNLMHRARFIGAMRRAFDRRGFIDVETPILTKATPEGARDYLVPSRVHPGKFYALPQSPQIFKQILMVSGFDRYYQVARCFRDEDLRADRQPEFTQLDMEMSFVEEEDIFAVWEEVLVETFRESMGVELTTPFPRLAYAEAMERYGSDKPDTRFGLELRSADDWAAASDFTVFRAAVDGGGRVRGIVVPAEQAAALSRKDVDGLADFAKGFGAKGLAWWRADENGGAGPLARFCEGPRAAELMRTMGAAAGDLCLFCADRPHIVTRVLGELRVHLGRRFGLAIPGGARGWNFLWVTSFPLFERDPDTGEIFSAHHPFTAPRDWTLGGPGADPASLVSRSYDLVLNGWELGSGSVRIHRRDVQQRVFDILGIGPDAQAEKFGFLLEALTFGAPPHGGFALGLDRTVSLTLGLDNLRDQLSFPKTTSATDLMCGAPSTVPSAQLDDVHIRPSGKALDEPGTHGSEAGA